MKGIQIREDLVIAEQSLQWTFSRSSGPGGQNVNKVNSKATLKWIPPADFLPPAAWHRFRDISRSYYNAEGEVVIQCQEFRDQARNAQRCRDKLAHMLRMALVPPKRRIKTRPSKSSITRRLTDKRREADKKRLRRPEI